jgi:hypothetical protein
MGIAPGMQRLPQTGPVLNRGVEGEEEAGETTPVSEWVKEHLGKENPRGLPHKSVLLRASIVRAFQEHRRHITGRTL